MNIVETDYIAFLQKFITENNIKSIVDFDCGDFACSSFIYDDLNIVYTGYNSCSNVIEFNKTYCTNSKYHFQQLDFSKETKKIITSDLCVLKDVMQHWSLKKIYKFLDYLIRSKKFKFILIENCCNQNQNDIDIEDGGFRELNVEHLPLRKYHPNILYNYEIYSIPMRSINYKEVSVIDVFKKLIHSR